MEGGLGFGFCLCLTSWVFGFLSSSQINWILEKFATYRTDLPKRNYTKEFLNTPHRCFMWKKESENKVKILYKSCFPVIKSIRDGLYYNHLRVFIEQGNFLIVQ